MDARTYCLEQIQRLDEAVRIAEKARHTTADLHDFFYPPADTGMSREQEDLDSFSRDTFKYFDANDAIRQLESLQIQLGELKTKLIEMKIANDRLLYNGGYLLCIDETISHIFLKNTLCKLKAQNENTPLVIEDTIQLMKKLRDRLQEMISL